MSARLAKVATAIRKEIATLVLNEMRDPRLAMATITDVRVSRDLMHAKVAVSVLGDQDALEAAVACLNSAAGFVRRELAQRVPIRQMPQLEFIADDTAAKAQRLEQLFREHHREFDGDDDSG